MLKTSHCYLLALFMVCAAHMLASPFATAEESTKNVHPIFGKWQYIGGTLGKVLTNKPIQLTFARNPRLPHAGVQGRGGCNTVSRRLRIQGNSVTLEGHMSATRAWCGRQLNTTENMVKRLLGHGTGWSVNGSRLTLYDASNQPFATFKRVEPR